MVIFSYLFSVIVILKHLKNNNFHYIFTYLIQINNNKKIYKPNFSPSI